MMAVAVVIGVMVVVLIKTTRRVTEVCSFVAEVARVLEEMTVGVLNFQPTNSLERLLVTVIRGTEQDVVLEVMAVETIRQGIKFKNV
ncbi:hypothetical protein ACFX1T_037845 [Malus domestica]